MIARTIKSIKFNSFLNSYADIPVHWVTDWLLHVLQKPASFLITDRDYVLTVDELAQFDAGIAKMQAGTPLAYLTGKQEFWSLEFEVNEHTLIPRPDTEVLVEQVLGWIAKHYQTNNTKNSLSSSDPQAETLSNPYFKLLDLGTGSGCIAISLAYELANSASKNSPSNKWQVTAIDYSKEALKVAKRNALLNEVKNIEFFESDWFSVFAKGLDGKAQKFEVIVSNPPYIEGEDEHLSQLKAEPLSALVAEDNGLADIKLICDQAKNYLVSGGLLAIEHGHDQGKDVTDIFTLNGYTQIETIPDYGGNDRVTMGVYY